MNGRLAKYIDILLGHLLSELIFRPGQKATTKLDALQAFRQPGFRTDAALFYQPSNIKSQVAVGLVRANKSYIREDLAFRSAYTPLSNAYEEQYDGYVETHTVRAHRYRPFFGGSRAVLLLLHGWTGGDYIWEERTLIPWLCRECGFTVVAMVHPYHGPRKPAASRFSGEFFLSSDALRTVEAFRQAVIDARTMISWLLSTAETVVGIAGISLGAFVTYVLLGVDGSPAFAVPMMGHGDAFDAPSDSSLTKNVRKGFQAQGIEPSTLQPFVQPLIARSLCPRIDPERILPINGRFDVVVAPDKAQLLFDAWRIPQVVWLNAGHFGIVHTKMYRDAIRDFVDRWL